ncbi:hypothetical protein [Mycolicibacter kumamotonensis]|uniref:Uncharacterized protein n=1 Tax=Mycolicibacter kumamotonensis TaxID=354243 RepID=A0A1B8SKZ5_9MYCO|nr:hypothetical protein [Mycolicibacter kumamotonensis]OBY33436.1 hypothetical protein ACT18_00315 [Mycolicibacter kumamotonensis]
MSGESRPTRGWALIFGFVLGHNIWAAGTHREMLSETSKRQALAHPVLVPLLALGLYAHLMGYLRGYDPITRMTDFLNRIF